MSSTPAAPLPTSAELVLTRVINAPRDLVWQAHTDCAHLKHWWGPKGFTLHTCKMDLRPGGTFLYGMTSPTGQPMWGRWVFREIVAPERLVYVVSFSDENAGVTRHPMAPKWPAEMLCIGTFAEQDGRTLMTSRITAINADAEESAIFEAGFDSMRGGFGATWDQFDAYLAKL